MSRRRYVSTDISTDGRINRLAEQDAFAALLYTWMIPHANDAGALPGDPEELMFTVIPGQRSRSVDDVTAALAAMVALGLIEWDQEAGTIRFPERAFYKYQTYIKAEQRRTPPAPPDPPPAEPAPENSVNQRTSPEKAVSSSLSSSSPVSLSSPVSTPTASTRAAAREAASRAAPPEPTAPAQRAETKLGTVIDGIRAEHVEPVVNRKVDAPAVKDCDGPPEEIAAAYVAASRGEWGDTWMRDNLSIQQVCRKLGGYRAWDAAGRPPARASPNGRGNGLSAAQLLAYGRGEVDHLG